MDILWFLFFSSYVRFTLIEQKAEPCWANKHTSQNLTVPRMKKKNAVGNTVSCRLKPVHETTSILHSSLSLRRSWKSEQKSRRRVCFIALAQQRSVTCLSDRAALRVLSMACGLCSIHLSGAHSCGSETLSTAYRSFNTVQINTLTVGLCACLHACVRIWNMRAQTQNQPCDALPEHCCLSAPGWMCDLSNTPPTPLPRLSLLQTVKRWVWCKDANSVSAKKPRHSLLQKHFLSRCQPLTVLISSSLSASSVRVSHSHLLQPSSPLPLTHISVSFSISYSLCFSLVLPVLRRVHSSCLFLRCFSSYLDFSSVPSLLPPHAFVLTSFFI